MKNIEFIKNLIRGGRVLFSGSFALYNQKMISRMYSDIDIVLPYSLLNSFSELYSSDYEFDGILDTKVKSIKFDDGTKVDIFFRKDYTEIKKNLIETDLFGKVYCLEPEDIILYKLYLANKGNQSKKHYIDISNVCLKLDSNIKEPEKSDMPF